MTVPKLWRFKDLKERGIVPNRPTMKRWEEKLDFPRGYLLGPNYRVRTEEEILAWLAKRAALASAETTRAEAEDREAEEVGAEKGDDEDDEDDEDDDGQRQPQAVSPSAP